MRVYTESVNMLFILTFNYVVETTVPSCVYNQDNQAVSTKQLILLISGAMCIDSASSTEKTSTNKHININDMALEIFVYFIFCTSNTENIAHR